MQSPSRHTKKLPIRLVRASTARTIAEKSSVAKRKQERMRIKRQVEALFREEFISLRDHIRSIYLEGHTDLTHRLSDSIPTSLCAVIIDRLMSKLERSGYQVSSGYKYNTSIDVSWKE
jgi:hypothetical protein